MRTVTGIVSRVAVVGGGFALVATILLCNLELFPGLHGDEARFGRMALDFARDGLRSPHGFNRYTTPFYPSLISCVFSLWGPSVGGLRGLGAVLNWVAFAGFWLFLSRRCDVKLAVAWLVALVASVFVLAYGRIAWEVTTLQNVATLLLLAIVLEPRRGRVACALYVIVSLLAAANHIIFLTLLVALSLGLSLEHVRVGSDLRFLAVAWLSTFGSVVLVGAKSLVSDALFLRFSSLFVFAFFLVIATLMAICLTPGPAWVARRVFPGPSVSNDTRRTKWGSRVLEWLRRLSVAWWLVSGLGFGFVQVVAGEIVYLRFASKPWPLAITLLVTVLSAVLVMGVSRFAWMGSDLRRGEGAILAAYIYWPACLAMTGRSQTSMRYYLLYAILFTLVAALAFCRSSSRRLRSGLAATAVVLGAGTLGFAHLVATAPDSVSRSPRWFLVGNMWERSHHFMSIESLIRQARNQGACHFGGNYFIAEPMRFSYEIAPWPCRDGSEKRLSYDSASETGQPFIGLDTPRSSRRRW